MCWQKNSNFEAINICHNIRAVLQVVLLVLCSIPILAQTPQVLASIRLHASLGTHSTRIGIQTGAYIVYNNVQLQATLAAYANNKHLGASKNWQELQASCGAACGFGAAQKPYEYINTSQATSNFCQKNFRANYSYNFYWDTRGTSQSAGTIKMAYKQLALVSENDAFAFKPYDRYRTGAIGVQFYDSNYCLATKAILWTGFSNQAPRLVDSNARRYVDIAASKFGKSSHGIFLVEASYNLPWQQNAYIQIGVDDEVIRDVLQNKLVHTIVQNKKLTQTRVPQLDRDGNTRSSKMQAKKPTQFYGQIGLGTVLFY
ncbi:MAG: hypothetical protein RL660_1556 [Bacteroidota bacterium]